MKSHPCSEQEISLKSFFLGPQSENGDFFRAKVLTLVDHYLAWRRTRFPNDGRAISESDLTTKDFVRRQKEVEKLLFQLLNELEPETPTFTPRYFGHMVSEVSVPALLGQFIALLHNPNNASREVSRVGLRLEQEAIGDLLGLVGFDPAQGRGHFTSGGTIANIESLWRSRFRWDHFLTLTLALEELGASEGDLFALLHMGWQRFHHLLAKYRITEAQLKSYSLVTNNPFDVARAWERYFSKPFRGPVVLVPASKHYSWQKGVSLMGLGHESFKTIATDKFGKLSVEHLEERIETFRKESRPIMAVVSVAGTTELGEVDPVDKIQNLLDRYRERDAVHIWHHVDAAYGGFYLACGNSRRLSQETLHSLGAISRVDSVTLDPHKLGYVPYACGALLLSNSENDRVSAFEAPYLANEKSESVGWSATLEGSRSAAGPVAMWLSARAIGLGPDGYGAILEKGLEARDQMIRSLEGLGDVRVVHPVDLNVVCFCVGRNSERLSVTNDRTEQIYRRLSEGVRFGVSRTVLSLGNYHHLVHRHVAEWRGEIDADGLFLIRLVLMNPFVVSQETKVNFIGEFCEEVGRLAQEVSR